MKDGLLFFDTETGGLDPSRHPVLQVAWVLEVDDKVVSTDCFDVKPNIDADLVIAALNVNGFTMERMMKGTNPTVVMEKLRSDILATGRRFIPVGHNVNFDVDMAHAMSRRCCANWWFNFSVEAPVQLRKPLCTKAMSHYLDYRGFLSLSDYKLATLCEHFGILLEGAHDALSDVLATRLLFHELNNLINML